MSSPRLIPVLLGGTLLLAACSPALDDAGASATVSESSTAAQGSGSGSGGGSSGSGSSSGAVRTASSSSSLFDDGSVHAISVTYDEAAYDAMIATYQSSGEKEWIEATVTIDGTTYEKVGLRLKGNSSLRSISGNGGGRGPVGGTASVDSPQSLPWLVKLDKYVDDQEHDGVQEIVVRSNQSSTSLNEALALELMELAGLPSEDAASTTFSVNGGEAALRLVVENPDGEWVDRVFDTDGSLYKAESTGDYSYRGTDAASYEDVFDLEAGDDDALTHLTAFLQFINESDDATFSAELDQWLDVDSFATYLAMQELVDNFDDIDGPGNNSYLYYDPETDRMTVVPWDLNLAFGVVNGSPAADGTMPGGGGGGRGGMAVPGGAGGGVAPGGNTNRGGQFGQGRAGGGFGKSNILVTRFLADSTFAQKKADALTRLQAELFDSGQAQAILERWADVLTASGAVDTATVTAETNAITAKL